MVAVGNQANNRCEVSGWEDVVTVSAGTEHTVCLTSDGRILALGENVYGQCDTWKLE